MISYLLARLRSLWGPMGICGDVRTPHKKREDCYNWRPCRKMGCKHG